MIRNFILFVSVCAVLALVACGSGNGTSPDGDGPVIGSTYEIPPYNVLRHGFDLKDVWANETGSITVGEKGMAFVTIAAGCFMIPLTMEWELLAVTAIPSGTVFISMGRGPTGTGHVYLFEDDMYGKHDVVAGIKALSGVHPAGDLPIYAASGGGLEWFDGANWHDSSASAPGIEISDICAPEVGSVWVSLWGGLAFYSTQSDSYSHITADGNWYYGISSLSITSALAVGGPVGAQRIWQYSPSQDSFVPVYDSPERLYAISWIDQDYAFAVGADGATVELNGSNWIPRHVDPPVDLKAVFPWKQGNERFAVAVGDSGGVFRFAQGQWTGRSSPKITCTELMGISPSLMFALHEGRLMRYDGEWEELPQAGTLDLHDFYCVSEDTVWAVGKQDIDTYAAMYNGTSWQTRWISSMEDANDVWVSDGGIVFVACDYGTVYSSAGYWAPMSAMQPPQHLRGVWGASSNSVYVVGDNGAISHWDGTTWTPMVSGTDVDLTAVSGSADDNVVAVGKSGTVLRYDGTSWTPLNPGLENNITMLWCGGLGDIWVAAYPAVVRHYDGVAWEARDTQLKGVRITGMWGQGDDFFILAENDLLLKYQPPPAATLRALLW